MKYSFGSWISVIHRFLILWLALISTRLIFWIVNASFLRVKAIDIVYTIPFDFCTIALYLLPLIFIHFLPTLKRLETAKKNIVSVLFYTILIIFIITNMWDVAYFSFSQRRTTFDAFLFLIQSPDKGLINFLLLDYFWISLATISLVIAFIALDRRLLKKRHASESALKFQVIHLFLASSVFFAIGRWSFGLKPLGVLDANKYVAIDNVPFVLNTAFVTLKTIQSEKISFPSTHDLEESKKYFNPIKETSFIENKQSKKNVVVIILESFGDNMIHQTVNGMKITPFTDSLLDQSYYYENGIANGKQSIEAFPAIFASMPHLMATPYILSSFCNNNLDALPSILKRNGYKSAFFHGAKNGSMRFDSFSKIIGFDHYYGKNEYPNKNHDNGYWGISDGYFNPWVVAEINKIKPPFCASIFTISSHHPYEIPITYPTEITKKLSKEQRSFYYADQSLRMFFNKAKKEAWYKNTLFVICADHVPQQLAVSSNATFERYHIPIAFFTPDKSILAQKNSAYFQQIDIAPFILDFLGIKSKYYAFGNDASISEGLFYQNGSYYLLKKEEEIIYNEVKNEITIINKKTNKRILTENNSLFLKYNKSFLRLKAIIARYRNDLMNNKTQSK